LASSDTGARAESIMRRDFRTARRGLRMADYFMEMMRGRCRALAITEDGTAASPLLAVLTDDDLTVDGGRNPALLVAEMLAAETLGDLAHVRARAEAFVAEGLVGPSSVEWFWRMVVEVDDALVERLVALAEREMARAGWIRPSVSSCWLLFGQAGRGERLAPTAFDLGAVYGDPAPEERERAAAYFTTLAGLVLERLPSCGLLSSRVVVDTGAAARPLSEWIALYADRVRDPIGSAIASVRSAFDVRAACGDRALAAELEHSVAAELERAEAFVPVLANDAIANLPPLTFTRDRVIDSDGVERATLDLEASALDPVADAARVAALAGRRPSGPNTLRRLEAAAAAAPQFLSIFDDAAEGFRILAYHDAVARRARPDDPLVTPARLGRFEQRMLKSAFDMARRFLDLTYTLHNPGVAR
jgi:CBS domain-containing protein